MDMSWIGPSARRCADRSLPARDLYIGQEQISFSTTPSLVNGSLEPRHAVVRCFAVAGRNGYAVMPGGLTRSAPVKGGYIVSNQAGGVSKDTWVLTSTPQTHTSIWLQADRIERAMENSYHLPSRAAENLFWVGRYAERAEASARLLRVILNFLNDGEPFASDEKATAEILPVLLRSLTHLTMTYPGFVDEGGGPLIAHPRKELLSIAYDSGRSGSLRHDLKSLTQSAYAVRDLWSPDTWRVIEGLDDHLSQTGNASQSSLHAVQTRLNHLITNLMAFAGLNTESMTHEAGWLLLDIGRRLDRALLTITLIRAMFGSKCHESARVPAAGRHPAHDGERHYLPAPLSLASATANGARSVAARRQQPALTDLPVGPFAGPHRAAAPHQSGLSTERRRTGDP